MTNQIFLETSIALGAKKISRRRKVAVPKAISFNHDMLRNATFRGIMVVAQHEFPESYMEGVDIMLVADYDFLLMYDQCRLENIFFEHLGGGKDMIREWLEKASAPQVIEFLKDIFMADHIIDWTGYRVSISRQNASGLPVWLFELFYKSPRSDTKVYSVF